MALFGVFDITASALSAQSVRLNVTASNLANADSVSSSTGATYRARQPVFESILLDTRRLSGAGNPTQISQLSQPLRGAGGGDVGVRVSGILESQAPLRREYRPDHPAANDEGFIFRPNVNPMDEMANMISASRTFQTNVEVVNAAKQMLQRALSLGR